MNNSNDTIIAGKSSNANQNKPNASKNNSNTGAKVAAGVGAAAVLGAGAVYGASQVMGDDVIAEEQNQNQEQEQANAAGKTADEKTTQPEEQKETENKVEEHKAEEHKAEEHRSEEHHSEQHHSEQHHQQHDNNIHQASHTTEDHHLNGVDVYSIDSKVDEDGNIVHVAEGTVDGHEAMFVDDGNGNVQQMAVDLDDSNSIEENEVFDVKDSKITMGDLAYNMVENEDIKPVEVKNDNAKVEVISVTHDDDMGDVAVVSIDDDPVMLVDSNIDGDADYLIHDDNSNQQIEENEIHELDPGIHMPTEDDVQGNQMASNDELPDYSNDGDITIYEV